MTAAHLPIDDIIPAVIQALESHNSVVIHAPPGAGKTTRIPPALIDAGIAGQKRLVMLEPRRIAVRSAAQRIAEQRRESVGQSVGYQVRFERRSSAQTNILIVTEGILPRILASDPYLDSIGVLVFDEFHERSLDNDFALGIARLLQDTVRPDLRIVVMSATLQTSAISRYLNDCPIIRSEGRQYPVEVLYQPRRGHQSSAEAVVQATLQMVDRTAGDILVFLPGVGEIKQVQRELTRSASLSGIQIMPLYGDLPAEQQDAALRPSQQRRIVLATNVAETSVTVSGITAVVDSGWARIKSFDPSIGLDRLELAPISRSSADQRAGRAGRERPGSCLRLWSAAHHASRSESIEPEIVRVDLAHTILQLLSYGEFTLQSFPWLDPPKPRSVQQALLFLQQIQAIELPELDVDSMASLNLAELSQPTLTPLGKQLAQLPVQPRIGKLLLVSEQLGCTAQATLAAALLSERSPFSSPAAHSSHHAHNNHASSQNQSTHAPCSCDIYDRVEALEEFERTGRTSFSLGELHRAAARRILQVRQQLARMVERLGSAPDLSGQRNAALAKNLATNTGTDSDVLLRRALFAAFADRLARRREPGSARGVMLGGRGVRIAPSSAVSAAEFFVCVEIEAGKSESIVRLAAAVEREWLPSTEIQTSIDVDFDASAQRVTARRRTRYRDLLIEESPAAVPNNSATAQTLAVAAANHLPLVLPAVDSPAGQLLQRIRWLQETCPDLQLPACSEQQLAELLPDICQGLRSFDELRRADWMSAIQAQLTPVQMQALRREAPDRLEVPSGNRIAVNYESGRPPTLSVRIQEVFGWKDTPRLGQGRVRVLLQLLGPNYRPQQVTDDLASFWNNGYPVVRKELRRRYPKHAWPEDPWNAIAEKRPRRKEGPNG